jgi:acetoin utilization deacetylase AcuC-like enzyme
VQEMLLPYLHTFKPDLLLISSGFDAHYDDMYHWLTEVMQIPLFRASI